MMTNAPGGNISCYEKDNVSEGVSEGKALPQK